MINSDDLATVVRTRLLGTGSLLPGGSWFNRGPDSPLDYPYLVYHLKPMPAIIWSGSIYGQEWHLLLAAYSSGVGHNPGPLQAAIDLLFGSDGAIAAFRAFTFRSPDDGIAAIFPSEQQETVAANLRDGKDILLLSGLYKIIVRSSKAGDF